MFVIVYLYVWSGDQNHKACSYGDSLGNPHGTWKCLIWIHTMICNTSCMCDSPNNLGCFWSKNLYISWFWYLMKTEIWPVLIIRSLSWVPLLTFRHLAKLPHLELGMAILCTPYFTNNYTWVASDPVFTEFGETFVADVEADPLGWSVCIGTTGNGLFVEFTYTA